MDIGKILIIVASVGLAIAFATILFAGGKSKKNKKKVEKLKEETSPKPAPEPKPKEDDAFKVSRDGKSSRVSRKALKRDSRTATVEKVYEREHQEPVQQSDVEVQMPDGYDKDFTDAVEQVSADGKKKKVVSIAALIKNDEVPKNTASEVPDLPERAPLDNDDDFSIDDLPSIDEIRERISNRKRQNQPPEKPLDNKGGDLSEMIEIDAIMNPKFKNTKK